MMTDLRTAAQQALEALEAMQSYAAAERKGLLICDESIIALRAALEQQEQAEPVTVLSYTRTVVSSEPRCQCGERAASECDDPWGPECDLGNSEEHVVVSQEPVAYSVGRTLHWHEGRGVDDAQLFASPPRREWVSLTDEGLAELARQEELLLICDDFDALREIARAVEAKLKEKNT